MMFNISTWNKDLIIDDVFIDFDTTPLNPNCIGVATSVIIPATERNGFGELFNDTSISNESAFEIEPFATGFPHFGGFNQTNFYAACPAPDFDLNVTIPLTIKYQETESDLFTFWVTNSESANTFQWATDSREGATPETLNMTLLTFRTIRLDASNTRFIGYDFEGNQFLFDNSSTAFDDMTAENLQSVFDFVYDTTDNILKIGGAVGAQATPAGGTLEPNSNLQETVCSFEGFSYSTDDITNINAAGEFERICFQLQDQHNTSRFFGVFTLFNTTCPNGLGCAGGVGNSGRDVGIFLSFIAAGNFQVAFTSTTPPNPQEGDNVDIRFTATKNSTGFVRYRTADANANFSNASVFSPFFTLNDSVSSTLHTIRIPNVNQDTFYQFFVFAIDEANITATDNNTDLFFNFTVGARGAFREGNESAILPIAIEEFANTIGIDFTTGTYIFGLMLLIPAVILGFMGGGIKLGFAALSGGICCFSIIGILPVYLLLPFLALAALILANIVKKGI